jgi:MFS family permease
MPEPASPDLAAVSPSKTTLRILSILVFNFANYLTIGLPLAILPGYVHEHLGYSAFWAGLVISLQYFATLLSRPYAGRYADKIGPKRVVMFGLSGCLLSGVFYLLALGFDASPAVSLALLCAGRILLGAGQSFAGTGSTLWGISVAFVGMRLLLPNSITRFGGLQVALACFVVEIVGLIMVFFAPTAWAAMAGAFITGVGFSLVYPALGVVAVKKLPPENQGSALATYSAFLDLSLGITGPLAGVLMAQAGIDAIYPGSALLVFIAMALGLRLLLRQPSPETRASVSND